MRSPLEEYTSRLSARSASHESWLRLDARLSHARLTLLVVGVVIAWLAFKTMVLSGAWLGLPVATFLGLMVWHDRVVRARDATARAIAFYARGIARIEDRWAGGGEAGLRFLDDDHPYAQDLDLFGRGSLFELLSIARTDAGENVLADWLKVPAAVPDLRLRHQAIDELRGRLDFREDLAGMGAAVAAIDTTALTSWATRPALLPRRWLRIAAPALSVAVIGSGIWWGVGGPLAPFVVAVILTGVCERAFHARVSRVVHSVDQPALDLLAHALRRLEQEPVASPRLTALRTTLIEHGVLASTAIARLRRLSEMHDWQHNAIVAPLAVVLLWSTQIALAIEAWQREFGSHVPIWIRTLGEYEALSSLAAYAYEHPADPFPTFLETGPALFDGIGLGHPLVGAAHMVTNDVQLGRPVQLLIVSGSNMSGKSTLLRTVGINAVLAQAGAPVRAARLHMSRLAVGATLRIQDSLQAGRSRFFAEISRVRQLADLATGPIPLLFLLDELFQGTNSHDRAAGAAAVLRRFLDRGALGLITTHDLALTSIADELGGRAVNVHFEDRFDNGELTFDYRMRPGPVTRSNALALMKAVGLEVDE